LTIPSKKGKDAKSIGDIFKKKLEDYPQKIQVISGHDGFFNLDLGGLVGTVGQKKVLPPGPLTVLVESELPGLKVGEMGEVDSRVLAFPRWGWELRLDRTPSYYSGYGKKRIKGFSWKVWEKTYELLVQAGNWQGLQFLGEFPGALAKGVSPGQKALEQSLGNSSPEPLSWYVGRGPGSTPSGDDFLTGILAVLSYYQLHSCWNLDNWKNQTNSLAWTSLFLAGRGYPPYFLRQAVQLLLAGELEGGLKAARDLLTQGATSGSDTLYGVLLAAGHLRAEEDYYGKTGAEIITGRSPGN